MEIRFRDYRHGAHEGLFDPGPIPPYDAFLDYSVVFDTDWFKNVNLDLFVPVNLAHCFRSGVTATRSRARPRPHGLVRGLAIASNVVASFAFFERTDPLANRVRAIVAARREALIWRRTRWLGTPAAYWSYLRLYSDGPHASDCYRRLAFCTLRWKRRQISVPSITTFRHRHPRKGSTSNIG
jgi:hypothetical protein